MVERRIEGKTAREWFEFGENEKDPEKQVEYYTKCLKLDTKNADAWYFKGLALSRDLKRHEKAIKCFDNALELDPKHVFAWTWKGFALYDLKRYEEALRCYGEALKIDSSFWGRWDAKGNALRLLERYEGAIKCYDKALDLVPQKYPLAAAIIYRNKGFALGDLKRYEEAIECYDLALEINPKDTSAWNHKGYALNGLERYKEAITCLDKALEINSNNAHAWYNKGFALFNLEKYEEAIRCVDKALELNSTYEDALYLKSLAKEKLKEPVTIERAIFDPCKRNFVESELPRMKEWINRYDPGAYWFAISLQNNTDRAIEEWGVELETSSALKIKDAKIEGIEIEIPHEAHLGLFEISVPKEYGIVIPKGGTQRVYFKLRAEKPKTTYEISGILKSEITGNVPIRAKEFKYLCDAGVSPEAVKVELKKTFSEKDAARLASAFRIAQDVRSSYCNNDTKAKDINKEFDILKMYLNEREILDTVENVQRKINAELREEERLDEKHVEEVKDFCEKFTEMWIAKFLR